MSSEKVLLYKSVILLSQYDISINTVVQDSDSVSFRVHIVGISWRFPDFVSYIHCVAVSYCVWIIS